VVEAFLKENKAFQSWYRGYPTFFDPAEKRIKNMYEWLQLGIKPWEWDYENYQKDKEMVGYFYPEDLENIKQLDEYERKAAAGRNRK
jgi:hypothetical protein